MSSIYFIALPLLFGFATPVLNRFSKNAVFYISTLMQLFLLFLSASLLLDTSWHVEIISIAPPLGISFILNKVSLFFVTLFTFIVSFFSIYYFAQRKTAPYKNETKFLILLNMLLGSAVGLVLSSDIFNIYVFFEIAGISAYILSAYEKTPKALEAAIKYLITGAIASIFLIFAIFLIYINLGSLNLAVIAQNFQTLPYNMKFLISVLLLMGFGFKVEIFPLNFWVTDIYQGSSPLVNALFSAIVVKAYIFVFFKIYYLFLPQGEFHTFLLYLGALSMFVAEIAGLKQTNLKRLFAYSSLGQVALIFTAFSLQTKEGVVAGIFILLAHSIAKFSIFLSINTIEKNYKNVKIDVLKELNSPFLKTMMIFSMLSLLGVPLLAGFIGKFLLLKSLAFNSIFFILSIVLLSSLLEALYYFKLMGFMFTKQKNNKILNIDFRQKFVFTFLAILLLSIGLLPSSISSYITQMAESMMDVNTYINLLIGVKS